MTPDQIKQEAERLFPARDYRITLPDVVKFAQHCVEIERERIRRLIAGDANACEFQSMGQYRSALLRGLSPPPEAA